MHTHITNTILRSENAALRDTVRDLEIIIHAQRALLADALALRDAVSDIPFPQNSPGDGTPWNAPTPEDYEIDGDDDPDRYDIGGSEWIDPTNGRDTWRN